MSRIKYDIEHPEVRERQRAEAKAKREVKRAQKKRERERPADQTEPRARRPRHGAPVSPVAQDSSASSAEECSPVLSDAMGE